MPITKSAKKAHARSLKLHKRNYDFKLRMKMAIKKFMKNIAKGADIAESELQLLHKYIDKACKVGVLKKQTAARKKSNITKIYNTNKKK